MKSLSLLALLCLVAPNTAFADGDEDSEELDFLDNEKAEQHRKAREADRAPAGDVFLEEDDEEDAPQWETSGPPAGIEVDDPDEDDGFEGRLIEGDEEDVDMDMDMDEDEDVDEDGDPIGDLSPADRASMMRPLTDNFPLTLVTRERGHVTVELPVLVAQSGDDFSGQDYWVVAHMVVNGTPVSEGRHLVTRSSISTFGPTKVWFKLAAPVEGPEADVEVRISHKPAQGSRTKPLFSRSLTIRM